MNLRDAILAASKFARVNVPGIMSNLLLLPAQGERRARVYGLRGMVGCLVELDDGVDVPHAAPSAKLLAEVAKGCAAVDKIRLVGEGKLEIISHTEGGQKLTTHLESATPSDFPGVPDIPESLELVAQWPEVTSLLHAVAAEKDDPELARVNFKGGWAEATDKRRIARVNIDVHWKGLIPSEVFKHWPKGDVEAGFTPDMAIFRVGDQTRIAMYAERGSFPACDQVLPDVYAGATMVVSVKELKKAVAQATKLSPHKLVTLDFKAKQLSVTAWVDKDHDPVEFEAVLPGLGEIPGYLVVDGKMVTQALRYAKTPNVRLGYQSPRDPLRIEAGRRIEGIWPVHVERTQGSV